MPDIDIEKIREATRAAKLRRERANRQAQVDRTTKLRAEGKKLAAPIIKELPARIEAAAAKGQGSISVLSDGYGHFSELQRYTMSAIDSWATKHGFTTYHHQDGPCGSDDYSDGSESFGIKWAEERGNDYW